MAHAIFEGTCQCPRAAADRDAEKRAARAHASAGRPAPISPMAGRKRQPAAAAGRYARPRAGDDPGGCAGRPSGNAICDGGNGTGSRAVCHAEGRDGGSGVLPLICQGDPSPEIDGCRLAVVMVRAGLPERLDRIRAALLAELPPRPTSLSSFHSLVSDILFAAVLPGSFVCPPRSLHRSSTHSWSRFFVFTSFFFRTTLPPFPVQLSFFNFILLSS